MSHTKKNNIVLIGFMGTGKSSIARQLKQLYQMEVVEMDEVIAAQEGMSIPEIFAQKGETYFRELETKLLRELQQRDHLVISCGGGAALRPQNVAAMKKNGYVFLLTASASTIYERVGQDTNRPVLNGYRSADGIRTLMESRRRSYESAADYILSTQELSARALAEKIMQQFQHLNQC